MLRRTHRRTRRARAALRAIAVASLFCSPAAAADRTWIGGSGTWNVPGNWTGAAVPTAFDRVFINIGAPQVLANVGGNGGMSVGGFDAGLLVGSRGSLSTTDLSLGRGSAFGGTFTIAETTPATVNNPAGVAHVWGNLRAGEQLNTTGGRGTLTLSGGFLTVNGTVSAGYGLNAGSSSTFFSHGTIKLFSGALTVGQALNIGDSVGHGTLTVTAFSTINAGSLNVGQKAGSGTVNHNAGTVIVTGPMSILSIRDPAFTSGFVPRGVYNLGGGTLVVLGTTTLGGQGFEPARLNVSGGLASLSRLEAAPSNSTIAFGDGGARVNQSGGLVSIGEQGLHFPAENLPNRTRFDYNLTGGTLQVIGPTVVGSAGTINFNGGELHVSTLTVAGGRVLMTAGGDKVLRTGTVSLTAGSGALVDLNDNAMTVNYAGASPMGSIREGIINGYNLGFPGATTHWVNAQTSIARITSTAARAAEADPAVPDTGLGYAEASALGLGEFMGQSVDATTVLIRHTLYGDGNLDGTVNIADFSLLGANFNAAGSVWTSGDFNYDGVTGIADFSQLAANFNRSLATPTARGGAVPEPAAAGLAAIGGMAVARLRRPRSSVSSRLVLAGL